MDDLDVLLPLLLRCRVLCIYHHGKKKEGHARARPATKERKKEKKKKRELSARMLRVGKRARVRVGRTGRLRSGQQRRDWVVCVCGVCVHAFFVRHLVLCFCPMCLLFLRIVVSQVGGTGRGRGGKRA